MASIAPEPPGIAVTREQVAEYYDHCQRYYNWFWIPSETLGMNYGFWTDDTSSRAQAQLNQFNALYDALDVREGGRYLEAGCGVGGASINLAQRCAARFVGVTLSAHQVSQGRRQALQRNLAGRVSFLRMDFAKTSFPDAHFDGVFGVESFCHAYPDPLPVYREVHRLLREGGRLVIHDGVLRREPRNEREQSWLNDFCLGWRVSAMIPGQRIVRLLGECGFENIHFADRTRDVLPSVADIHRLGRLLCPGLRVLRALRLVPATHLNNARAGLAQKRLVDEGILAYATVSARREAQSF